MIGHDDPGEKAVRFVVVEPKVVLDHLRNLWIAEMTSAKALIEQSFHAAKFFAILLNVHGLGPFVVELDRDGIGQSIGDELSNARRIKMRKIAAGVPAFETLSLFSWRKLMVPTALFFDHLFGGFRSHEGMLRTRLSALRE